MATPQITREQPRAQDRSAKEPNLEPYTIFQQYPLRLSEGPDYEKQEYALSSEDKEVAKKLNVPAHVMARMIDIIEKLHGPWQGKRYRVLPLDRVRSKVAEVYPEYEKDLVPSEFRMAPKEQADYIFHSIEIIFSYWRQLRDVREACLIRSNWRVFESDYKGEDALFQKRPLDERD